MPAVYFARCICRTTYTPRSICVYVYVLYSMYVVLCYMLRLERARCGSYNFTFIFMRRTAMTTGIWLGFGGA